MECPILDNKYDVYKENKAAIKRRFVEQHMELDKMEADMLRELKITFSKVGLPVKDD